jgi:hypothetical protein
VDKVNCPANNARNPVEKQAMQGEGEGASLDAEDAAEELGDPLPGLLSPHLVAM